MISFRLPDRVTLTLARRLIPRATYWRPDVVIGGEGSPYLCRWYVIPRNRWFNIYLHRFHRSDDDRALHDHPWPNASIILGGSYTEHTIAAGGIHRRRVAKAGDVTLRSAKQAHRIELHEPGVVWSLFLTGPRIREWGFHCPEAGWRHWKDFTDGEHGERIGRGCDD